MKAEAELGAIGYATPRPRASGVGIFAGGILTLLTIMVGVPLLMVVLMSLRTGFPGEGGPLTLTNFIAVYSTPSTYKILWNTLLFAFHGAAGLVAQSHRHSVQEHNLRPDDCGNFDPGVSADDRLDITAQSADRLGQSMGDADLRSRSADHQPLPHSGNGVRPGSFVRAVGF